MATYHGLIKVSCIACNWETQDDLTMEILNDMDGVCPKCEEQFFRWDNQDGSIVVSLTRNIDGLHTYDNLVWNQALTVEQAEREYPTVEEVLEEMQKTNPIGWRLTYEYPDSIGVWSDEFTSDDQFIMFGDVNGYFAFNDVPADKVVGSMEEIYTPEEIVKSFWNQIANFYPQLIKGE
jgi:hypothetical protein